MAVTARNGNNSNADINNDTSKHYPTKQLSLLEHLGGIFLQP